MQVSRKATGRLSSAPGATVPTSIVPWAPAVTASPSAASESAETVPAIASAVQAASTAARYMTRERMTSASCLDIPGEVIASIVAGAQVGVDGSMGSFGARARRPSVPVR